MSGVQAMRTGAFTLSVDREMIDTTSGMPTWRESWRATDVNGHEHYYKHGFPTLRHVVDEKHWCDGNEGISPHDPHMHVDRSHFECLLCDVVVEPATDPPFTPKSIPGAWSATLAGPRSDGVLVEAWLLEDEWWQLAESWSDDAALRVLDAVPDDRLISASFASR